MAQLSELMYSYYTRDLYKLGTPVYSDKQDYLTSNSVIDPSQLGAGIITNPISTTQSNDPIGSTPPGILSPFAGATSPSGWLLCDGSAVSRQAYQALFDVISTSYGVGDGSTTFNIPDMRGYTPYGLKASDTNFDALNTPSVYVGEKDHTLTIAEMPAHTHPPPAGMTDFWADNGGTTAGVYPSSTTSFSTQPETGSTGDDDAHNNMPPYRVVNFIIKT